MRKWKRISALALSVLMLCQTIVYIPAKAASSAEGGEEGETSLCEVCGADPCTCEQAEASCPYCEYTLAEDGTVIHSATCNAAYAYDGSADRGKYVQLIPEAAEYGVSVSEDPVNDEGIWFYYDEFGEGTVMKITDWYWDPDTTGLWYCVELYSGSFPESTEEYTWPETPWILHDYTDLTYEYDATLEFVTVEESCGCCENCTGDETCTCECEGCTCAGTEPEPEVPTVSGSATDSEGNELTDSNGKPITVTVTGEALPEGAQVKAVIPSVNGELLSGVYDIKVYDKDGNEWQPIDEGTAVTVTIPVSDIGDWDYVEVYHFIDAPQAFEKSELECVPIEQLSAQLQASLGSAAEAAALAGHEGYVVCEYCGMFEPSGGVISFTTDSFSVYYFTGTEYATGDADVESNPANLCSVGSNDDGKYYFVNRGDYVFFYGTSRLSWSGAQYDYTLSAGAFDGLEETSSTAGFLEYKVFKTRVSDTAKFYNQGYKITNDYSGKSINIVVMPTLTIKLECNLEDWEEFVTFPDSTTVSGVFMGNCPAAEHDPANGKYGALNYTLSSPVLADGVTGYTFTNWYVKHAPGQTFTAGETISLSSEDLQIDLTGEAESYTVTLVANFETAPHKITYVNDDVSTEVEYTYEGTVAIQNPTKEGYTLTGWTLSTTDPVENWTDKFGVGGTIPGGSTLANMYGDVTLTAQWEANTGTAYAVQHWFQTASLDDYDISSDVDTLYGETDTLTDAGKALRSVIGFEVEGIENKTIAGDGTTVAIIKYKRVKTTITFIDPHDGSPLGTASGFYGTPVSNIENPTKPYYAFMGWYTVDAPDQLYTPTTMPATDLTLYAKWNIKKATITFVDADNNNNVLYVVNADAGTSVSDPTIAVDPDTEPKVSKEGYTLVGWYSNAACTTVFNFPYVLQGVDNVTVYSKWQINTYTITWNAAPGQFADGTTEKTVQLNYGETPRWTGENPLYSTDDNGYTWVGWTPAITTVTGDITYTAVYTEWSIITWMDYDGTTVLETDRVETGDMPVYDKGTPTREATAQYTYTFDGWDPIVVSATKHVTYTAQYKATVRTYTVTFVDHDGTVLKTEPVAYGSAATAPTVPERDGYNFTGWDTDFSNVTSDLTVTAQYEAKEIISVTVTWGSLLFDYTYGAWQPTSHTYEADSIEVSADQSNTVTVRSDGNVAVDVSITYAPLDGYTSITGYFTVNNDSTETQYNETFTLTQNKDKTLYLWLSGTMDRGKSDGTYQCGTCTVTIAKGGG